MPMVTTQPWLLISVMTMRRLGGSVNADIVVINSIMTGDRVVMGDGKFGEAGCCCCCYCCCWAVDWGLDGTAVGRDIDKSSLISLRLLWFYGSALNTLGSPPGPSAPAAEAAAAATVTPAVAALVRAHFRWLHQIHQTGGPHRY
jgi:hypothetical protein